MNTSNNNNERVMLETETTRRETESYNCNRQEFILVSRGRVEVVRDLRRLGHCRTPRRSVKPDVFKKVTGISKVIPSTKITSSAKLAKLQKLFEHKLSSQTTCSHVNIL